MKILEMNEDALAEWLAERPQVIRDMVAAKPPDRLYRIGSGHRCTIYSYAEDRTVTVYVGGEYNAVIFSRHVFGIPIDELVECDPPGPDELTGDVSVDAGFSPDDVRNILIPKLKEEGMLPETCAEPECAAGKKPS